MSKKAFEKIEEGLLEVLAIVRGEAKPTENKDDISKLKQKMPAARGGQG